MAAAAQSLPDASPKTGGKKKLLVLVVVALLVLGVAAAGAVWFVNKQRMEAQAAMDEEDPDAESADGPAKHDTHRTPPAYLPLDPFVVNLADRDSERFAQIGITLELEEAQFGDQIKAYMPAIRNGILMVMAHKTSTELLTRAGKEELAGEIMREVLRPLGIELQEPAAEGEDKPAKSRRGKILIEESPVRHVHFSSFIIQ